jgi:hypothetical protein
MKDHGILLQHYMVSQSRTLDLNMTYLTETGCEDERWMKIVRDHGICW